MPEPQADDLKPTDKDPAEGARSSSGRSRRTRTLRTATSAKAAIPSKAPLRKPRAIRRSEAVSAAGKPSTASFAKL